MITQIHNLINALILSVLLLPFPSCRQKQTDSIDIPLPDSSEHVLVVNNLVSQMEWIQLESIPQALIKGATRIIEHDGKIYILDLGSKKDVLAFNAEGKFLNSIGIQGNGPGEYTNILDFAINTQTGEIAILAPASTVYIYKVDGSFVRSIKLTESLLWHIAYSDGHYICTSDHCTYTEGENAYLVYTFAPDFKLEGKYIPALPQQLPSTTMFEGLLSSRDGIAYYMDMFTHTLYEIAGADEPVELYVFSLPDPMPISAFVNGMDFYVQQSQHDWIKSFMPLDDSFLLTYVIRGHLCMAEITKCGNMKLSGLVRGMLPKMFPADNESILSPVSSEAYHADWLVETDQEMTSEELDSNIKLLRWKLNKDYR